MDSEVKIPPGSKKVYKSLVLDNGLKVMLISDPMTSDSAAAMAVQVGSSQDPLNAQGLSHLLEHMLFCGSEAYPQPKALTAYLRPYGGTYNAFTQMDYIMFHFSVVNVAMKGALKRFGDPFISPLFKEECLETEITAIEHEFEAIRHTDKSRLDQLKGHTAPPGHPFNRFTWGNRKSLSVLKNDKLIELLTDLFNKHFVGCSMCLVVLGKESVGVLKSWVEKYFGRINQGSEVASSYVPTTDPIWKADTLFLSKSAEDINLLDITWNIPPISHMKRPEQYLVLALSHKCEGSLYAIFKKKGWLISLDASYGDYKVDNDDDDESGSYACTAAGRLFSLSLELTNLGSSKVYDIVGFVYQYLHFLRHNFSPRIMEEYFLIRRFKYQWFDTYDIGSNPDALTKQIAVNMVHLPLEDSVCADHLNQTCSKESVDELLKCFTPSFMRLDLSTKSYNEKDLTEPFFNTFYTEEKVSSQLKDLWLNPRYAAGSFQLPNSNPFLPTNVAPPPDELLETDDEAGPSEESDSDDESATDDDADLVVDDPYIKLWHLSDESVPTLNLSVLCNIGLDLRSQVLGVFYLHLLKDSLEPILSQGKEANLTTSITLSDRNKFEIKTRGFKERLQLYISAIWKVFTTFSPSPDTFLTDKEIVGAGLVNNIAELEDHSKCLLLERISKSCYSVDSMLSELKLVAFEDMTHFISDLRSKMFIEGVFFGNILRDEAESISKLFEGYEIASLPEDMRDDKRTFIRKGSKATSDDFVRVKSDINSVAKVSFQIGTKRVDAQKTALVHLFYSMIEENLISWLRMKKNLGYEVGAELQCQYGIKLFSVSVISSTYNPEYLLEQIYLYLEGLEEFLEGMKANEFRKHRKALCDEYPDDDGENLWEQITEKRRFRFNKRVRRILKKISKKDVVEFYKKYFVKASRNTRMLSIRIWGCNSIPCA